MGRTEFKNLQPEIAELSYDTQNVILTLHTQKICVQLYADIVQLYADIVQVKKGKEIFAKYPSEKQSNETRKKTKDTITMQVMPCGSL